MKKEYKKLISLILAVAAVGVAPSLLASCNDTGTGKPHDTSSNTGDPASPSASEPTSAATTAEVTPALTLRVGSYNIKHGADASGSLSLIGNVIKDAELDIVGVQEVDYKTQRVDGADQPAQLAAAAGMKYYKFARAIDYKGGEYGTLILSRYPIKEFTVTQLETKGKEGRSIGHAVIDVNGTLIDFFNTHLSYEESSLRVAQFQVLKKLLSDCETYILTGDFNTDNYSEFSVLGYGGMVNNTRRHYVTFPGSDSSIDNIVYSANLKDVKSGTVSRAYSDHNMLWAELTMKPKDQ